MFPPTLVNDIEAALTRFEHDWHYIPISSGVEELYTVHDEYSKDCPQMIHPIFTKNEWVSPYYQLIKSMLYFVEDKTETHIKSIHRIKANLTIPDGTSKHHYNTPHKDHDDTNFLSMVYYVHDSDGDTVLFDKFGDYENSKLNIVERISPKRGRCVIFPSTQFHSSSNPINFKNRIILNFVFEV